MVTALAQTAMWCRGCPSPIRPGEEYVKTGDPEAPTAHLECRNREWRDGEGVIYEFAADDEPRCYVPGCGETDDLEPCFVGEYVCQECKVSPRHQRELAGECALEGAEG